MLFICENYICTFMFDCSRVGVKYRMQNYFCLCHSDTDNIFISLIRIKVSFFQLSLVDDYSKSATFKDIWKMSHTFRIFVKKHSLVQFGFWQRLINFLHMCMHSLHFDQFFKFIRPEKIDSTTRNIKVQL